MTIRLTILCALPLLLTGCGNPEKAKRHREIAEWTIEQGGGVYLGDSTAETRAKKKLPEGEFVIRKISLNNTKVTDKDLDKLKDMTDLVALSLHTTKITDKGLDAVAKLSSLEELELSNTGITNKGMKKLTELRSLKKLFLNQTTVTKPAISEFKTALPECKVIKIQ